MGAESEGSGGFKVDRVLVDHLFFALSMYDGLHIYWAYGP